MDRVKCNNIAYNGPGMWKMLHAVAVRATTDEKKIFFEKFLEVFMENIACPSCITETKIFMKNFPIIDYRNIIIDGIDIGYFKWTWELHNTVNQKMGKKIVTLTDAYKYFTTVKFDCKACINLDK